MSTVPSVVTSGASRTELNRGGSLGRILTTDYTDGTEGGIQDLSHTIDVIRGNGTALSYNPSVLFVPSVVNLGIDWRMRILT